MYEMSTRRHNNKKQTSNVLDDIESHENTDKSLVID